jgi:hypothetical protein
VVRQVFATERASVLRSRGLSLAKTCSIGFRSDALANPFLVEPDEADSREPQQRYPENTSRMKLRITLRPCRCFASTSAETDSV